jgi:hypothetical protein
MPVLNATVVGETARIVWMGGGVLSGEGYRFWGYVYEEIEPTLCLQNSISCF